MRVKHSFNMVEILIALGVCAIGVCSVMVLFPVGASASRDAAMETYAANAADQMLHYLKYQITEGGKWGELITNPTTAIPDISTDPRESADNDDLTALWSGWPSSADSNFENIFLHPGNKGIYLIKSIRGTDTDFTAIMFVWRSDVDLSGVTSDFGVTLNVEVTWPAEIPYEARQKSLYCLEVFNPN